MAYRYKSYEEQYICEMRKDYKDFVITIKEFDEWLESKGETMFESFKKELKDEDIFFPAVDFNIPIIMVKYYIKKRGII